MNKQLIFCLCDELYLKILWFNDIYSFLEIKLIVTIIILVVTI